MLVFNSPPGWPRMPRGWMPPSGWSPDPRWPKCPLLWTFGVDSSLRMRPIPLREEIDFGHPAEVTRDRLSATCQGAADAVAWRVAEMAAEARKTLAAAHHQNAVLVRGAVRIAQGRVFDRLVAETRTWVNSLPPRSSEQRAALAHARMILDLKEGFPQAADRRINAVLSAATQKGR